MDEGNDGSKDSDNDGEEGDEEEKPAIDFSKYMNVDPLLLKFYIRVLFVL